MHRKAITCWLVILTIVLTSCTTAVRVIHHPASELTVDETPFSDPYVLAGQLGCDRVETVPSSLGGLDPSHPLAYCINFVSPGSSTAGEGIFRRGCMLPQWYTYIIYTDRDYRHIRTSDEFKSLFAPVSTADEALSYAIAMTDLHPVNHWQADPKIKYQVRVLEDTHVTSTKDGFDVLLFYQIVCGCGPHTEYQAIVHITSSGDVTVGTPIPLYDDPSMEGLCVD